MQSVQRVASIVWEITSATVEQSAGIERVNQALTEIDQVTRQNAALVEQVTAAAESMLAQVHRIVRDVSVFRMTRAEDGSDLALAGQAGRPSREPCRSGIQNPI